MFFVVKVWASFVSILAGPMRHSDHLECEIRRFLDFGGSGGTRLGLIG